MIYFSVEGVRQRVLSDVTREEPWFFVELLVSL